MKNNTWEVKEVWSERGNFFILVEIETGMEVQNKIMPFRTKEEAEYWRKYEEGEIGK